jgi:hypothetical protein
MEVLGWKTRRSDRSRRGVEGGQARGGRRRVWEGDDGVGKRADERAVKVSEVRREKNLCHVGPASQRSKRTFSLPPIVRSRIVRWLVRRPVGPNPEVYGFFASLVSSTPHCLTK